MPDRSVVELEHGPADPGVRPVIPEDGNQHIRKRRLQRFCRRLLAAQSSFQSGSVPGVIFPRALRKASGNLSSKSVPASRTRRVRASNREKPFAWVKPSASHHRANSEALFEDTVRNNSHSSFFDLIEASPDRRFRSKASSCMGRSQPDGDLDDATIPWLTERRNVTAKPLGRSKI